MDLFIALEKQAKYFCRTAFGIIIFQSDLLIFYQADLRCKIRQGFLLVFKGKPGFAQKLLQDLIFLLFCQDIGRSIMVSML